MKLLSAVGLIACSVVANAAGVANLLTVDLVRVDKNGMGHVQFTSNLATPASCATTAFLSSLAFDTNTAGGQSILTTVLTAKASNKPIYAVGTNACALYGVMEDWSWGYIK